MALAKLFFLGREKELHNVKVKYKRKRFSNGKPKSEVLGGYIDCEFSYGYDDAIFYEYIQVPHDIKDLDTDRFYFLNDGEIHFYENSFDEVPFKIYRFKDATIKKIHVKFNANGDMPMLMRIILSPAIQNYGAPFHKWWRESPLPEEEAPYMPPVVAYEKKEEKKEEDKPFPVWTHYQMTYEALIKAGIEEETANEIAHYASTYADNPNGVFMVMNMGLAFLNYLYDPNRLSYDEKKYGKYDKEYSQFDHLIKAVSIHGMRTYWEDITPQEAIKRALYGGVYEEQFEEDGKKVEKCKTIRIIGAYEVIDRLKGRDINNLSREDKKLLGTAFHTIQDAVIHRGGRWVVSDHEKKAEMLGHKNEHPDLYEVGTAIGINPNGEFDIAVQKTEEAIKMIHKKE